MAKEEKPQAEEKTIEAMFAEAEAPASINIKFVWRGFDTMLTIRDAKVATALKKYEAAIGHLEKMGATPTPARSYGNNHANASGQQSGGNGGDGNKPKYCTHKSDEPGFCPEHGKELKKSKHHPGYYCPMKL